jgi:hypothetical protein
MVGRAGRAAVSGVAVIGPAIVESSHRHKPAIAAKCDRT